MQINLKRALKLRKELEATLAKVDLPSTGSINLLIEAQRTNPANMVVLAQAVYANKVAEYVKLSHILADLRIKLDEANISSGIHRILAEVADLDRRIGIYKKVVAERVAPNKELIEAEVKQKVADNAAPESRSYGRDRSIGFAVASVGGGKAMARGLDRPRGALAQTVTTPPRQRADEDQQREQA